MRLNVDDKRKDVPRKSSCRGCRCSWCTCSWGFRNQALCRGEMEDCRIDGFECRSE
ncbi:hypothetical protein BDY17DRAFT_290174 [Neohortaea acidophila]|uniref:Uncharacterized protein n=1 Tax=Neohortaea acidophila TaxID=245834 RepID=A0A6A6Q6N6_9PEZI|nr:uncharacterized protein BDY17DRAFT_290174 [Neohortaea acidophila]KAF2488050.1 hypothetical protein BDY17DRAFT_290174 [Neohortaea acidophila]